jgi:hypothetical protein
MASVDAGCYGVWTVMRTISKATATTGIAVAMSLLAVSLTAGSGADAADEHEVVGRFTIESEAGGAIWAFLPGGLLVVTGPGDISSEGTWTPSVAERDFDASLEVTVSGQVLDVLGQVSPAHDRIAVYVVATEPTRPEDADPWPAESRLIGERFGMVAEPSPSPLPLPEECARPEWVEAAVDWDRCSVTPETDD